LKRIFGKIRDLANRSRFALFIDELQDLRDRLPETTADAAFAIIRGEVQYMSKIPVFFAGSARESFMLLFTSDASPFYEHAPLVAVEPVPDAEMEKFIERQFALGIGIDPAAAQLICRIAGGSTNDVQRLGYETWNEQLATGQKASSAMVQRAFEKVLRDATAYGEKWLSDLSRKQLRVVFAVAFLEHLGASSAQFLEFAGVRNPGEITSSLAALTKGKEALIEKVGSRFRFRSRFARLWFALRYYRVQALIPAMRDEAEYRRVLTPLLPPLPFDPLKPTP